MIPQHCHSFWPSCGCHDLDRVEPLTTPEALRGDKAYSTHGHRAHLWARGIQAVFPRARRRGGPPQNNGSRGGRPVGYDVADYKNRNVIERAFNQLKNGRGIATRYDKQALVYRGGVVLAAITVWLRA